MDPLTKIKLIPLLREREACFDKVFHCERSIELILGEPYPLPPPPRLPSTRPPPKPPGAEKRRKPYKTRRLRDGVEHGYLVRFTLDGETREELHSDPRLVDLLVESKYPGMRGIAVSTVAADESGSLTRVETLFELPEAGSAGLPTANSNKVISIK